MATQYTVQKNNSFLSISEEYLNKKDLINPIEVAKVLEEKLFNPIAKLINDANKETTEFSEFTLNKIKEYLPFRQNSGEKHFLYLGHFINGLSCYVYSSLKDNTYYAEIAYEEGVFFPNNPAKDKYSTVELIFDTFELIITRDNGTIKIDGLDRACEVFLECFSRHLKKNTYPLRFREYRVKPSFLPNGKGMKIIFNDDEVTLNSPFCRSQNTLFKEFTSPKANPTSERLHLCIYNLFNYVGSRYDTNGDSFLISGVNIDDRYYYHICNRKGDFERIIPYSELVSTLASKIDEYHPKVMFKAIVEYCENVAEYRKQDLSIFLLRFVRFVLHHYSCFSAIYENDKYSVQTRVYHSSTVGDQSRTPGYYIEYTDASGIETNGKRSNLLLSDKEAKGLMSEDIGEVMSTLLDHNLVVRMYERVLMDRDNYQRLVYDRIEEEMSLNRSKVKKAISGYLLKLVNKYQTKYRDNPTVVDYLNSFYTTENAVGFGRKVGKNAVCINTANKRDDFTGEVVGHITVCSMLIGGMAFYSDYDTNVTEVIEDTPLAALLEVWMDICCRMMLRGTDTTVLEDSVRLAIKHATTSASLIDSIYLTFSRDDFLLCEHRDIDAYVKKYHVNKRLPYHFFINLNLIDKEDGDRVKTYTLPVSAKRVSLEEDINSFGESFVSFIYDKLVEVDNAKEIMIKAYDIIDEYNRSDVNVNGKRVIVNELYRYV